MALQKFAARIPTTWGNGAKGWAPGGMADCIGPFAKVENCPINGTTLRRTCYATGYADTFFSVPAATRVKGRYVGGYLTMREDGPEFVPFDRYSERVSAGR